MVGLLEGQLAKAIYNGFKGKLLKGTLYRTPVALSVDDKGDPIPTTPTAYPIQGFDDMFSAFYRASFGIPDTDVKINIFAQSMPGVTPQKDDVVHFPARGWFQLRIIRTDPAQALWECQAYKIPARLESS